MKHPHTMPSATLAVLAAGLLALYGWGPIAEAQHGRSSDPEAHFAVVAERLELTAAQRETLAEPFYQAFAAMEELHRLHDAIAADLTDAQKAELAEMIHGMLDASSSSGKDGHRHHPRGERHR